MDHTSESRRTRSYAVISLVSGAAIAVTLAMVALGTQFRPIADDYFHIGRVMEMGVVGSTADWYVTLLPGFFGVLLMSIFALPFGAVPDYLAYVPYTAFVVATLYLVGFTLLRPFYTRGNRGVVLLLSAVVPPLWLLSMGNLFPQYDVINAFGMLSWISNGYRFHLPLMILIFFFWMNWWSGRRGWGVIVGGLGMLFLTLNFLNPLPDIAAYFALCTGTGAYWAWRARGSATREQDTRIAINASMAAGVLGGLLFLLFSPGTSSRMDAKPLQFTLEAALQSVPYQFMIFLREMANISHLLVLAGAVGLSLLVSSRLGDNRRDRCLPMVRFMTITAIALSSLLLVTGMIGETLTYNAIFHRWVVLQVEFVAIVLVGLWIGLKITASKRRQPSIVLAGLVTLAAVVAACIPLLNVLELSVERRQLWDSGQPAPVSYMVDREQEIFRDWWERIRPASKTVS